MFNRTNLNLFLGACAMFTISGAVQIQNNDHNETFTKLSNSHFLDTKSENFSLNSSFRASTDANSTCDTVDEGDTSSLDEFPEYFTEDQLRQGFVVLHIIGVVYFFVLLALICSNYFLPTVECICEDFNLSKDVAAATFMSTATTMPEFFTNTVSVLITDSDMGLGTIIGSLMFNTLGVAGIAALAIKKPVQLDWWPITRDCCIYSFNTLLLLILAWGGRVTFVESSIMVAFLIVYYVITFFNSRLMPTMRVFIEDRLNCCLSTRYDLTEPPENSAKAQLPCNEHHPVDINGLFTVSGSLQKDPPPLAHSADGKHHLKDTATSSSSSSLESGNKLFAWPRKKSKLMKCWWGFTFPLEVVLKCLIPNPITHRKLYPLTFVACVVLIGANAFMIVWMLTAIGVAMGVPEIIMGLTILAAGSAMPEAISSTIALRSGESGIGVSNSLGANSLAILLSLGVPWFIKNCMHYNKTDGANAIIIATHGIGYNILILMFCTIALFLILSIGNYRLTKRVGAALICVYSVFIVLQVLLETNMFFPRVC